MTATVIGCPTCGRKVSSAAAACPGCGHPLGGREQGAINVRDPVHVLGLLVVAAIVGIVGFGIYIVTR